MRNRNTNRQLGFILDVCHVVPYDSIQILETNTNPSSGVPKATFKAVLQTLEEKNNNGRYYSRDIGKEIVETLKPKAKGRCLFQEVDHPNLSSSSKDDVSAKRRAVTVEMKNCGSLIRDIYLEGNKVIGEIETLSGFLGPDVYNLIVHDKADIGYSLRMFGRVEMEGSTGMARVMRPVRPITYDTVSNPSHSTAKIIEFLSEGISDFILPTNTNDVHLLNESSFMDDNLDLMNVNESIYDYVDRIVDDLFSRLGTVEFKL